MNPELMISEMQKLQALIVHYERQLQQVQGPMADDRWI
ncbi:hypothetical protein PC1_2082 [Pectobacterium carotovorum subsp. carotovorum PC1]|uniref:Uncharacterized protein n=1 Tax=Pectobacterium carotovorum subsp. carotovorum (strain PC1) TaxID=561230 RepID=C6DHU9_PECCP|nr:hypothetical protein PC1_2082 [Pectobacterium carotovorum subsp. carotovorum PC1]